MKKGLIKAKATTPMMFLWVIHNVVFSIY